MAEQPPDPASFVRRSGLPWAHTNDGIAGEPEPDVPLDRRSSPISAICDDVSKFEERMPDDLCELLMVPADGCQSSTVAPIGLGGCRWGDRAGRVSLENATHRGNPLLWGWFPSRHKSAAAGSSPAATPVPRLHDFGLDRSRQTEPPSSYPQHIHSLKKREYGQSDSGLLRTNSQAAWASDETIFQSLRSRPEIITR